MMILFFISTDNPARMKLSMLFYSVLFFYNLNAQVKYDSKDYVLALKSATDVMVSDVTSPVAASRYYAFITLAAYETVAVFDSGFQSLSGTIRQFTPPSITKEEISGASADLTTLLVIYKTAQKMLPSGFVLKKNIDSLIQRLNESGVDKSILNASQLAADKIVKHVVAFSITDGFRQLQNRQRYTPRSGQAYWQPTPPVFMAPVEPHWNTIRTFLLDSAQQFKPALPARFNLDKKSDFYKQLMEVYTIGKQSTIEQREIASFWDCNPFAVQQIGHVEFGLKKISPGGHWIGIVGIAATQSLLSFNKTALAHALTAIALADGFIACWDEKYRSNRVRPETIIQQAIDPAWRPLLQTPPFPEYVSGHSVASHTAAILLGRIFGESFKYDDDTEVEFGLPVRKYFSFKQAAEEAAISRLYGGIHYRDAITAGEWQGKQVGKLAISKFEKHFGHFN
jgi:hypothetical protein